MFDQVLSAAFLILTLSFVIAALARKSDPRRNLDAYLFSGNNHVLAWSSNVGSMLSIAMIFSFYIVTLVGGGMMLFVSVASGYTIGWILLDRGTRKLLANPDKERYVHATYVTLFSDKLPKYFLVLTFSAQYAIALVLEFSVLKDFLYGIFDSNLQVAIVGIVVAALCGSYVVVGGYLGVLRTDFFQLVVVGSAFAYLISNNWAETKQLAWTAFDSQNIGGWYPIAWITIALTAAVWFFASPDMWVRNFSSLQGSVGKRRLMIAGTWLGLIFLLVPLTLLGLAQLNSSTGGPIHRFDVPVVLEFFVGAFSNPNNTVFDPVGRQFAVAGFLCIFITTIDTWLIGTVQHALGSDRRRAGYARLFPFVFSIGALILGALLPNEFILPFGLLIFPFYFFNPILFISEAWLRSTNIPRHAYTRTLWAGIATTLICELVFINNIRERAWHTMFASAVAEYTVFTVFLIAAKRGVPVSIGGTVDE